MSFICYVFDASRPVPYMEVLPAGSLDQAEARARDLLAQRPQARSAELWNDDALLLSLDKADARAA